MTEWQITKFFRARLSPEIAVAVVERPRDFFASFWHRTTGEVVSFAIPKQGLNGDLNDPRHRLLSYLQPNLDTLNAKANAVVGQ